MFPTSFNSLKNIRRLYKIIQFKDCRARTSPAHRQNGKFSGFMRTENFGFKTRYFFVCLSFIRYANVCIFYWLKIIWLLDEVCAIAVRHRLRDFFFGTGVRGEGEV